MQPRLLTESEFRATFGDRMIEITGHEDAVSPEGVLDVIPYVEAVPIDNLTPHVLHNHFVDCVYRSSDDCFDHVLFMTKTKNVYLVIVIDLKAGTIKGHRILDLNKEYGLFP